MAVKGRGGGGREGPRWRGRLKVAARGVLSGERLNKESKSGERLGAKKQ